MMRRKSSLQAIAIAAALVASSSAPARSAIVLHRLGTAPVLPPIESSAQLQHDVATYSEKLWRAARADGITAEAFGQFRRAVAAGRFRYVTLPRHLDAMSWGSPNGTVGAIFDVTIPPGQKGWEVDVSEGSRVAVILMPAICGNIALGGRVASQASLPPPARSVPTPPAATAPPAPPPAAPITAPPATAPPSTPSPAPAPAPSPSVASSAAGPHANALPYVAGALLAGGIAAVAASGGSSSKSVAPAAAPTPAPPVATPTPSPSPTPSHSPSPSPSPSPTPRITPSPPPAPSPIGSISGTPFPAFTGTPVPLPSQTPFPNTPAPPAARAPVPPAAATTPRAPSGPLVPAPPVIRGGGIGGRR